jgi:hypothetical protein
MSFIGRIQKFAKSPEGKKVMKRAQELAKDPHTKQRIEEVRERLLHKDEPAGGAKTAKSTTGGAKAGGATAKRTAGGVKAKPKAGGPAA